MTTRFRRPKMLHPPGNASGLVFCFVSLCFVIPNALIVAEPKAPQARSKSAPMHLSKPATYKPDHITLVAGGLDPRFVPSMQTPAYLKKLIVDTSEKLLHHPDDIEALKMRGYALWKTEQFEEAEADLEKALALTPKGADAELSRELSECYMRKDAYGKALSAMDKAIRIDPDRSVYYLRRSQILQAQKNYPEAMKSADTMVSKAPTDSWVYDYRARLCLKTGEYQKGVDDCTKALRLQSNWPTMYSLRASLFRKLGRTKEAEADDKRLLDQTTGF